MFKDQNLLIRLYRRLKQYTHICHETVTAVSGILLASFIWTAAATADDAGSDSLDLLKQLSLEELANLKVSIVSKRPERLADTAAAAFVITADDIRRSGATSIPDLLRIVPGLNVARIDAMEYSVSSRGFPGLFANKLLVLIDGRSIYTPLFAGVFWQVQDTLLEDIERIEVIRGPGAAVWGANAVNGVINIITKSATDTQGGLLSGYASDEEYGIATRYGDSLTDDSFFRIYAKHRYLEGAVALDGNTAEGEADDMRAGFRIDWQANVVDLLRLQGDIYRTQPEGDGFSDFSGGNLLASWQHEFDSQATGSLQVYYDRTKLSVFDAAETRDTLDIEYRHQAPTDDDHSISWGLGYRISHDKIDNSFFAEAQPDSRTNHLFSGFIQDDIALSSEKLYLTLGTKLEHNDYTGFEFQPSARLRWYPDDQQILWAAISRAIRTPTRSERSLSVRTLRMPASAQTNNLRLFHVLKGTDDFDSESLLAFELGHRIQIGTELALDITAFYNDYDTLRGLETSPNIIPEPLTNPEYLAVTSIINNAASGKVQGLELSGDWRINSDWRLQINYSFLDVEVNLTDNSPTVSTEISAGENPSHQLSLHSAIDIRDDLELDIWLHYVDQLPSLNADSYITAGARLAWRVSDNFEISVVGRNLVDNKHLEYIDELLPDNTPREIERDIYARLKWRF